MLKSQQKFRSKKRAFVEEVNKIALSANNDKRTQQKHMYMEQMKK